MLIALPEECGETGEYMPPYVEMVVKEEPDPDEISALILSTNYTPASMAQLGEHQASFDKRMTAAILAYLRGDWMGKEWSWLSDDSLLSTRFNGESYYVGLERQDEHGPLHLIVCLPAEN